MDPMFVVVGIFIGAATIGTLVGGRVIAARETRARMDFWRDAGSQAGLGDLRDRGDGVLIGSAGPFRVQFRDYVEEETRGTLVEIWSPRLPPSMGMGAVPCGARRGFGGCFPTPSKRSVSYWKTAVMPWADFTSCTSRSL